MDNLKQPTRPLGGIIHTYLAYDPKSFPSPTKPPPDVVSGAFEHMLRFGSTRELTPEQLANAIKIDPSQIKGFGPSIETLIEMLEARKRKILATYETDSVLDLAKREYLDHYATMQPPDRLGKAFTEEVRNEHLRGLERLWYHVDDEQSPFAMQLLHLIERLGEKYQVDELAATYDFSGRESMTVPRAIEIKEELEKIDELLKQLREALENAQIGIIDMEALSEFAEPGEMDNLRQLQQQIDDYLREIAERQGLEFTKDGYQLSPKAFRLFQGRLLEDIFSELDAARRGRHSGPIVGEGAVEMPRTKAYEFGDSVTHMDIPQSLINAMLREPHTPGQPVRMIPGDIEIHETRNTPKCATTVVMDMSGSMRYDGQYINVKRMALALDGLIRKEYPGDFLQFIEMYTIAKPCDMAQVPSLMPKPVTLYDPVVRLMADMSDERISEFDLPPHFTNIQHGLQLSRQFLQAQDTPNRQIILITDGLPTAHFEQEKLFLLYPPDRRTEEHTMREAALCVREGITINIFLLPNWGQTEDDVQFAHRMAESTRGRVFFTGGRDLDRFVIWDYVQQRRKIIS
ncbi:MAG: hypothetical protein O7G85_07970 [Planctomycetota bacterium]|nr:hypothetical protein [Planctomycetota bacterium]